jgi:predicted peptidase
MRISLAFSVGVALLAVAASSEARAANVADFVDFSLRNTSGAVVLPGRLYVPPEAVIDSATLRPFIVFLHGGGETGTNNTSQVLFNIDNLLAEAKRRGAFLYAPQSPGTWSSASLTANVMTMVDRALSDYRVNENRLYVTGLSNGGGGTWNMLSRFPDRFAAGVPICGVNPASDFVSANLVDQAIAAFHARNDTVVSFATSRSVYNQILTASGETLPAYPNPRDVSTDFVHSAARHDLNYVEFALGGHGIWTPVYNSPQLYAWLFAHAIPEPSAEVVMMIAGAGLIAACRRRR